MLIKAGDLLSWGPVGMGGWGERGGGGATANSIGFDSRGGGFEKFPVFYGVPGALLWWPYGRYGVTMVCPSNGALCLWRLCLPCEQGKLRWARQRDAHQQQ